MTITVIGMISVIDGLVIPFVREDLESFRKYITNPTCDVCKRNHTRHSLWIVRDGTNTFVAGRNCLNNLFGKDAVTEAIKEGRESRETISTNCYDVRESIGASLVLIDQFGYTSTATSGRNMTIASKTRFVNDYNKLVLEYLDNHDQYDDRIDDVINYYNNCKDTSTFAINAIKLVNNHFCSRTALAMFPAISNTVIRARAKQRVIDTNKSVTEYLGNIGDKITNTIEGEVIELRECQGIAFTYYDSGVYTQTWIRAGNHVIVTNRRFPSINVGDRVAITRMTIKSHFDGNYGHCTQVIRASVHKIN